MCTLHSPLGKSYLKAPVLALIYFLKRTYNYTLHFNYNLCLKHKII